MLNPVLKVAKKVARRCLNKIEYFQTTPRVYRRIFSSVSRDRRISKIGATDAVRHNVHHCMSTGVSVAATYCEVANFLLNCGQPETAQTYFKLSLKAALIPATYSLYLQCLLLSPTCSDKQMYLIASRYFNVFLSSIKRYDTYENDLSVNRPLNVGYICHFFHNSVSQSLLIPFLKAHDRARVKVFCYSDAKAEEVSSDIKQIADGWRDTLELDDAALAALIRKDQIDVLLELNGHCVVNRYGVIARKPAPIQVCYYNQCGTTGISAIDYNLIGDEVCLDKSQRYYSESVYFINGAAGIAEFPDDFPECAPPPCLKNGYITFGSFGAAHKVNADVIKLWCKVLKKIPTAKFYMKAGVLSHQNYIDVYKKMFADNGVGCERVHLEGYSEHRKMLECYANVDIALDTFPHAAGTTTMEALWQGVPVLTLCGERYASQNGRSILSSVGHPELVAYSEEEFVKIAMALAATQDQLIRYRKQLREDFKASPRANAAGLSKKLDDAYHDMWAKYCIALI